MSPIRNDKQMAHYWSMIPLKLLLLSAHLQLALTNRKYEPIADPAVLRRLDVNSPRMSELGSLGQAITAIAIDRTEFMEQWYWTKL